MPDPAVPDDRPAWLRQQPGPAEERPGPPAEQGGSKGGRAMPVVTWTILGVNLVLVVVEAVLSGSRTGILDPSNQALCRLGALNSAAIAESGQWWRLFTAMVLHGGIIHFAVNSWALWIFGPVLERTLGRVRFTLLYLISGFVASAFSFAFKNPVLSVGASGAIFGLLGALIAFFWRRRAVAGSRAQLQSLIVVLVLNLIIGFRIPGVDYMAHIGGLIGGFTTMLLVDLAARRRDLEALAMAAPVAVAIGLVAWGVQAFPGGTSCVGIG